MKLGPTGKYPDGTFGPDDGGELTFGIARDSHGNVVINFGTDVSWIAMPISDAIEFAKAILKKAGAKTVTVEW